MSANGIRSESSSRDESASAGQKVQFTTTNWNLVLVAAQEEQPGGQEALEQLCCTYWYPLYAFVRRQGYDPHTAQDHTQAFLARLLERQDFAKVSSEKG